MQILRLFVLIISTSFIYSWNSNTCAWGVVGNNQPKNATECMGDQTNPVSDCCFMSLKFPDNTTFNLCSLQAKLHTSMGNENLKIESNKLTGNLFTVTDFTCRNTTNIPADPINSFSYNTCSYDFIKNSAPVQSSDCTKDKDPSGLNKCCFVTSKWNGVTTNSCSSVYKLGDTSEATMKTVYANMGAELLEFECEGGYYIALSMIYLIYLFLF